MRAADATADAIAGRARISIWAAALLLCDDDAVEARCMAIDDVVAVLLLLRAALTAADCDDDITGAVGAADAEDGPPLTQSLPVIDADVVGIVVIVEPPAAPTQTGITMACDIVAAAAAAARAPEGIA